MTWDPYCTPPEVTPIARLGQLWKHQAVTHSSTNIATPGITSVISRELVYPKCYALATKQSLAILILGLTLLYKSLSIKSLFIQVLIYSSPCLKFLVYTSPCLKVLVLQLHQLRPNSFCPGPWPDLALEGTYCTLLYMLFICTLHLCILHTVLFTIYSVLCILNSCIWVISPRAENDC